MTTFLQTRHSFTSVLHVITFATLFFLTSCGNWGCSGNSGGGNYHTTSFQPNYENRPSALPEAEKQMAVEHQLRVKTEERLQKQESTTDHWQSVSLLISACAGVLLLVGTALGASARHEAEKK